MSSQLHYINSINLKYPTNISDIIYKFETRNVQRKLTEPYYSSLRSENDLKIVPRNLQKVNNPIEFTKTISTRPLTIRKSVESTVMFDADDQKMEMRPVGSCESIDSAVCEDIIDKRNRHRKYKSINNNSDKIVSENDIIVKSYPMATKIFETLGRASLSLLSVTGMGLALLFIIFALPRSISQAIVYPGFRLTFGTLYPAYASYKAIRSKDIREYCKWMMYWIVFAIFTSIETFTDILISWFPFYYEVKVVIVIWLLSPATKGSSILYRKFVHPYLTKREQDIDEYIVQAKEKGYMTVLQLGSKGVNYATNVIMQTAIRGGGNIVSTLRKSYSLSDLSEPDLHRTQDEIDEVVKPLQRVLRSRTQSTRSSSSNRNSEIYFSEVDISSKHKDAQDYSYIRSSEDISSGYSSAEHVSTGLSRTASLTHATRSKIKGKRPEESDSSECEYYPYDPAYQFYGANIPYTVLHKGSPYFYSRRGSLDGIFENIDPAIIRQSLMLPFQHFPNHISKNLSIVRDVSNFEDTISDNSSDEYLETVDSSVDQLEKKEKLSEQYDSKQISRKSQSPLIVEVKNPYLEKIETILSESQKKITCIEKDLKQLDKPTSEQNIITISPAVIVDTEHSKRPITQHKKRRAPNPPSPLPQELDSKDNLHSEAVSSFVEHSDIDSSNGKKKKNLSDYISSIFKPISPATSNQNLSSSPTFKETEI